MKLRNSIIVVFLGPAVVFYLLIFLYPSIRTLIMSFFYVKTVTASMAKWSFVGLKNYRIIFQSKMFIHSLSNIFYIWFYGGLGVFFAALLYAVILTSGVKGKSFFRDILYLPNVITAVALATMWIHFAFNNQYGLFKIIFQTLGLKQLAEFQWTAPEHELFSMTVAYSFGCVGYYVLIFMAGIEKIPTDFYEAATIEGAGIFKKFTSITLPLLIGVMKTAVVLWSIAAVTFFLWSMMFSPYDPEMGTITPMVYMYNTTFGRNVIVTNPELVNAGLGAAVGVVMTIIIVIVFLAVDRLLPDQEEIKY
ncbi:MAG: sugar ABC transporter permease [Spirochaetales bacterium]|nr:sugar ABC transporter permease [Spirochaetales bacterium]